ncbi:MAG: hypothetical protein ABL961_09275 [Vicinamibacterales bacterium]
MVKTRCAARRVVTLCLLAAVFAGRASGEPLVRRVPVMPSNIRFARELQSSVDTMLEMSRTFREQFERIASAPRLIIDARIDMRVMQQSFRARSCIRRYDSGLVIVSMEIAPDAIRPEWIAHEFEHILEQLEGLPLSVLAEQGRPGVWFSGRDMVETSRATAAGRLVRDEMRVKRTREDKFVE